MKNDYITILGEPGFFAKMVSDEISEEELRKAEMIKKQKQRREKINRIFKNG